MNPTPSVDALTGGPNQIKKIGDVPSIDGPSMETLTQRFQSLMVQEPASVAPDDGQNGLTNILDTNDQLMQRNADASAYLATHGSTMAPEVLAAAGNELIRSHSISQFRNQAISSIASSTSKSIQSLLKNS